MLNVPKVFIVRVICRRWYVDVYEFKLLLLWLEDLWRKKNRLLSKCRFIPSWSLYTVPVHHADAIVRTFDQLIQLRYFQVHPEECGSDHINKQQPKCLRHDHLDPNNLIVQNIHIPENPCLWFRIPIHSDL